MSDYDRFEALLGEPSLVHLDASILALHVAGIPASLPLTRVLFQLMESGDITAQTSALSLYQLLMESYRRGEETTADRVERLLGALPGLTLIPLDGRIARQAAQVRARIGGKLERSVQLATALSEDADLFLTRHSSLRRVAGMRVESLDAYTPQPADPA
ncbi:MAG: PIN domain-containing protein [marine benthic group bacterium]|nr:PIN domain-containing protein [Gemmatimonadota bacterium]